MTEAALHELELYREFFSRLDVEDQIAFGLPSPPGLVLGLAVSRCTRGFSTDERELLAAVTPFAAQAYWLAQGRERAARVMSGSGSPSAPGVTMAVIDIRRIVLAFSEEAAELSERYLGESLAVGSSLPGGLDHFVTHQRQLVKSRTDLREAPATAELLSGKARLLIRLIPAADEGEDGDLLLLEERSDPLAVERAGQAGLTDRQVEVSRLLVEGHTNAQIARSLYLSSSTVKRHLETIYSRLDVSNRAQAAATLARRRS